MVVYESGDGADGGGRWMKDVSSGRCCHSTGAFLSESGSRVRAGGLSGSRVA